MSPMSLLYLSPENLQRLDEQTRTRRTQDRCGPAWPKPLLTRMAPWAVTLLAGAVLTLWDWLPPHA